MKKSMIMMAVLAVFLCSFAFASIAEAKPHTLSWDWPVSDCDGTEIVLTDLLESELIYSLEPMPMPSDTEGQCAGPDDDAPAGALSVPIPVTPDAVITLNLRPGETYYARIKVSAFISGNWSVWSEQLEFTVPYGRPHRIKFTDARGTWIYYTPDQTSITELTKSTLSGA